MTTIGSTRHSDRLRQRFRRESFLYGWDTSHFAAPRSVGAPVSIVNADLVHEIGFYAGAGLFVPKKVGEADYLHVGVGQHRHRLVCRLDSCDNRKSRQQHVRG